MTRLEAIEQLRKLGPQFCYSVGRHVTSPERRAAGRERMLALLEERKKLDEQIAAATTEANAYKFTIYKRISEGFIMDMEVGKGDTWEEAFAQVENAAAAAETSPF